MLNPYINTSAKDEHHGLSLLSYNFPSLFSGMYRKLHLLLRFNCLTDCLSVCLKVFELPSGNLLDKHLVQLLISAVRGLGVVEPQKHETEDREAAENKGELRGKVGLVGVEQERENKAPDHVQETLSGETNRNSLDTEAGSRNLDQHRVSGSTDSHVVPPAVNQNQGDCSLNCARGTGHSEATSEEQDNREDDKTPERERTTPDLVNEEPGHDVTDKRDDLLDDLELEAHFGAETGKLDVVSRVRSDKDDT